MQAVVAGNEGRQRVVLAQADLTLAALSLFAACWMRDSVLPFLAPAVWVGGTEFLPRYPLLLFATLPILIGALYAAGVYRLQRIHTVAQIAASIAQAFLLSAALVLAFAFVFRGEIFSRAIVVSYVVFAHLGFFGIRWVVRGVQSGYFPGAGLANAVVVGTGPGARAIATAMYRRPRLGYRVLGFVKVPDEKGVSEPAGTVLGTVDDLPRIVEQMVVDAVMFGTSLEESARYEGIIWKLEEVGTTVHLRGGALGSLLSHSVIGDLEGTPILTIQTVPWDPFALRLKRIIDIAGALIGLIALSPIMLLAAVAVRVTSPGPIFYRQERLGLNGRRFEMLKFRSMYQGSDGRLATLRPGNEMSGPVFKMRNDPRMTPAGQWLRRYSIDELPQLWNVLMGDMSLVGPRPPLASEVGQYQRWQRRRLSVKPGITCLWQVNGRNDLDFDTWMKLDMEYIDNWSLALDLKILVKTIPVVLTTKGAC